MAKKNHDPNEDQNEELEFDKTMNLEEDSDLDSNSDSANELTQNWIDPDSQELDDVGRQTVALGDDDELIDQLLQADTPAPENALDRTIQLDDQSSPSGDSAHLTEKLESSKDGDPIGSRTIDSGSMGSSQLAAIWRNHFDSNANPMMSYEIPSGKTSIGDEYKLNPRYVTSGVQNIDNSQEIDYRLGRLIGEGGMGEVLSANQQAVDRMVAFKRIRKTLIDEASGTPQKRKNIERKFLTEAHITASLDHPNIVTIHDLGIDQDGNVFYCMEFISGSEWHQIFKKVSLEENLDILLRVADGIAYAHSKDIIHRDLKPENVMIGKFRQVSIMDWGLAVDLKKGRPNNLAGTPAYLAPEMAKGPKTSINKSSDIYLLGALLFHICTGYPPHHGKSMSECIQSAAKNTFRKADLPDENLRPLLSIAYKAMETYQEDRYATVNDFQDAIRAFQATQQSVSQSFALSKKSAEELAEAQNQSNYEKYSSALFGYRESLHLFPENSDAATGIGVTKRAYANCALERQDFELGLSLLDEDESDDQELIQRLEKSKKVVETRKKRVRFLAIASTLLLSGFLLFFAYSNVEQRRLTKIAEGAKEEIQSALNSEKAAKIEADKQKEEAVTAKEEAEIAKEETERTLKKVDAERKRAEDAEDGLIISLEEVRKAKNDAEAERVQADIAKERAIEQENLAKSRLFNSNINLADSLIRDNQIPQALAALNFAKSADNSADFLGWEYNRLLHLCHSKDVVESRFDNATGFSPISDNQMAVVGRDGTVTVWNQKDSTKVTKLRANQNVSSFDVSRSGQLIAIGSAENKNKLTIWDLNTGKLIKDLSDSISGNNIYRVEFSSDGTKLVVADSNSGVYGWRVSNGMTGQALKFSRLHSSPVLDFSFSSDGSSLATISNDGLCLVWDWDSQTPITSYAHSAPLTAVAFRPSKRAPREVACADSQGQVIFLDATIKNDFRKWMKLSEAKELGFAKERIRKSTLDAHQSAVNTIDFSRNGKILYTGGDDRVVRIWDLDKQIEIKSLRGHDEAVSNLRALDDGVSIASIANTGQLRIWNFDQYEDQRVFNSADDIPKEFVRFSQNGRWFAEGASTGKLFIRDKNRPQLSIELAYDDNLGRNAAWLPRSERLVTSGKNRLSVWTEGQTVFETKEIGEDGRFAVSTDETRMITGGDADRNNNKGQPTSVWNIQTGEKIGDLLPAGSRYYVTAMAISPDNRYAAIATGSTEGIIFLFDLNSLQKVDEIEAHRGWVSDLKFFPDNRLASADSLEGYVNVWNISNGQMSLQKKVDDIVGSYIQISIAPDGQRFVTSCNKDGSANLQVWNSESFASVSTKEFDSSIRFIEFREDSEIAYVQADGRYGAWDLNQQVSTKPSSFEYVSMKGRLVNGWNRVDENTTVTYGDGFTFLTSSTQSGVQNSYGNVSRCIDAHFIDDDRKVAALYADGLVRVWDLESRTIVRVFKSESESLPINGLSVSPDHQRFVTSNDSEIKIIDGTNLKTLKSHSVPHNISAIDWSRERLIYLGTESGKIVEVNLDNLETNLIDGCDSRIDSIKVSSEGSTIGFVAKDADENTGLIYLLRQNTREAQEDPELQPQEPEWVAIKQNGEKGSTLELFDGGKRFASGSQSGIITIWEIPQTPKTPLRPLISMPQSDNAITGISISPDNRLLLSCSLDSQSVLWLTAGWEEANSPDQ